PALAKNIVPLVRARIDGAPAGVKGSSLFIVPKFLPTAEGGVGPRNEGVKCVGLEEKMGIHGNATCFMSYEGATGYLIGEETKGLRVMFVMMNEARLGVAVQGLAQAEAAYQAAAAFARDRLQGRALNGPKNPARPCRSDHRAPGRAAHADGLQGGDRGGTGPAVLDHPAPGHRARLHRRG